MVQLQLGWGVGRRHQLSPFQGPLDNIPVPSLILPQMCDMSRALIFLQRNRETFALGLGRMSFDIFVVGQFISATVDIRPSKLGRVGGVMVVRLVPFTQRVGQKTQGHGGGPENSKSIEERRSDELLDGREPDTDEGHCARDAEEAWAGIKDGDVWGEALVLIGACRGGVLLVQVCDAGGAAVGEDVDENGW